MVLSWLRRSWAPRRPQRRVTKQRATCQPFLETLEERAVPAVPASWDARGPGGGGALFSPSISPHNGNDLFIASDMGEVFHSANAGQAWDVLNFSQIQGSRPSGVQFTEDPNILYSIDVTNDSPTPPRRNHRALTWTRFA